MRHSIIPFRPNPESPQAMLVNCPAYAAAPLITFNDAEARGAIWLKDETNRMGLGSFKALGGIYAVAQLIMTAWAKEKGSSLLPGQLIEAEVKSFAASLTFVCASAGNHGLAVAEGARLFGANARIYLDRNVPPDFETRLKQKCATIIRSGATYEESNIAAISDAERQNAILLSDSSWKGYSHIPSLVMEGYTVIAEELKQAFELSGQWPTDVFLQAGVGGFAAAMSYMIRFNWSKQPKIHIIEPETAACLKNAADSKKSNSINSRRLDSQHISNMGRLDCKIPSDIALFVLENANVSYMTITDKEAADAAVILAIHEIYTTPSGAAGYAGMLKLSSPAPSSSLIIATETSKYGA